MSSVDVSQICPVCAMRLRYIAWLGPFVVVNFVVGIVRWSVATASLLMSVYFAAAIHTWIVPYMNGMAQLFAKMNALSITFVHAAFLYKYGKNIFLAGSLNGIASLQFIKNASTSTFVDVILLHAAYTQTWNHIITISVRLIPSRIFDVFIALHSMAYIVWRQPGYAEWNEKTSQESLNAAPRAEWYNTQADMIMAIFVIGCRFNELFYSHLLSHVRCRMWRFP